MEFIEEFICRVLSIIPTTVSKEIESGNLIRDLISFGSFLVVLTGCWNAFKQWKYNLQLKRAEYLEKLIDKLRSDEEFSKVIARIDKGLGLFDAKLNAVGSGEQSVDNLLTHISYLLYLKNKGFLKDDEFDFIKFDINRILRNDSIQTYLFNLYHHTREKKDFPFPPMLMDYFKENIKFKGDFLSKENTNYQHILEF